MTTHLIAFADGLVMGTVTQARSGQLTFSYSQEWPDSSAAYPLSISMPLAPEQYGQGKIEPFLWGLLPDNEIVLGQWARKFHVSPRNAFGLIVNVGEDCAGAVQFVRPERLDAVRLVSCPGDFVSTNTSSWVGISPAKWFRRFGVAANEFPQ